MSILITLVGTKNRDGSVTINKENGDFFCRYSAYLSNKPDYHNKRITINCWPWALVWNKGANHAS